jgi:hypothetical protein
MKIDDNVIPLRPKLDDRIRLSRRPSPFDNLTATLVVDQYRRGVLPEGVILALLAAVGIQP